MSSSSVWELKQTVSVVQQVKELKSYTHLSLLLLLCLHWNHWNYHHAALVFSMLEWHRLCHPVLETTEIEELDNENNGPSFFFDLKCQTCGTVYVDCPNTGQVLVVSVHRRGLGLAQMRQMTWFVETLPSLCHLYVHLISTV